MPGQPQFPGGPVTPQFPGGPVAPQFPGGPGQPAGPPRSGAPVAAILAIVMVLLIGGGVGGYFLLSDSEEADRPPANAMPRVWETKMPATSGSARSGHGTRSMWHNGKEVIYGDSNGVRAFNADTGKKTWTVKAPKAAGEVCAMSEETSVDGVGAVVFDAGGDDCSFLSLIDTETGRMLWSRNLKGKRPEHDPLVVVNKEVVVAAMGDTYGGFAISGGGDKVFGVKARGHLCTNNTALSPQYLAISSDCSDAKPKRQLSVQDLEYDSINWRIPGESRAVERTLSDRPLTLLMQSGGGPEPERSIQTYTDEGKPAHTFPLKGELKDLDFESHPTIVDEDEQVMISAYQNNGGVAATDLKTGKLLWSKLGAFAFNEGDGKVTAIAAPAGDPNVRDPRVVDFDLRTGTETVFGTLYDAKHSMPSPKDMSLYLDGDFRLFIEGKRGTGDHPSIQSFKMPNTWS